MYIVVQNNNEVLFNPSQTEVTPHSDKFIFDNWFDARIKYLELISGVTFEEWCSDIVNQHKFKNVFLN